MQCKEIISQLETLAPVPLACEWDNPGLLVGSGKKQVSKVMIALDATDEAVEEAVCFGADLLLTHHPLIFKPLKKINDEDFISRRILRLIQADIAYYVMHTNFDAAPGCMADAAAGLLKLENTRPLMVTAETEKGAAGIGRIGTFPDPMSLEETAAFVKEQFNLPFVTVYGDKQVQEPIRLAAVSPGSGGSMLTYGLAAGVQVMITGDIGHHEGIDAAANHMAVIDAGHYGLEHIFLDFMERYLKEQYGDQLEIRKARPAWPAMVVI